MSHSKMSARDRVEMLFDASTFVETGALVTARSTDYNVDAPKLPGDGVITGYGVIGDRMVYVYSQDASVLGGSLGEMHARKIADVYDMAIKTGAPVVGMIDSAGLRLGEAGDALEAFGSIFARQAQASGRVPQICAVFGQCAGGTTVISALSDFTFIEKEHAAFFVNSPNSLPDESAAATARAVSDGQGTKMGTSVTDGQGTKTGTSVTDGQAVKAPGFRSDAQGQKADRFQAANADFICDSEEELIAGIRSLIAMLPSDFEADDAFDEGKDDLNRIIPELNETEYDARFLLSSISDRSAWIELKKDTAPEMVTAFIRLNGETVGAVANQPFEGKKHLSARGLDKAVRFVQFCDSFNIPILTVTNVTGLSASFHDERRLPTLMARFTAALAGSTVPRVNLIAGEAYGTAAIVMNSKAIGADFVLAWPEASLAMMDPDQAVRILYSDQIRDAEDQLGLIAEKKAEYEENKSSAQAAARRGYIDDIIEPDASRKRLIAAYEMLFGKKVYSIRKKHSSI